MIDRKISYRIESHSLYFVSWESESREDLL